MLIKVLQVNLNRSRIGHDLMQRHIREHKVDVVIVSEPNVKIVSEDCSWIVDHENNAAIKFISKTIKANECGNSNGFVWIKINDLTIYGGYFSPNKDNASFNFYLQNMQDDFTGRNAKNIVIAGDFNAKAYRWGSPTQDSRGTNLSEWVEQNNLQVFNSGNKPTFVRGKSKSFIDLTICSSNFSKNITNWMVNDEENFSDHQNIYFIISDRKRQAENTDHKVQGWKVNYMLLEKFTKEITTVIESKNDLKFTALECTDIITEACNQALPIRKTSRHKPVYWWTLEIAEARKLCLLKKRKLVRENKKPNVLETNIQTLENEYKGTRTILKLMIQNEKRKSWNKLIDDLDQDVYGDAYKIACKRLRVMPKIQLTDENMMKEAMKLFPRLPKIKWNIKATNLTALFTEDELREAGKKIRTKKAPGPDRIPPEIIKIITQAQTKYIVNVMNKALREAIFPI